MAIQLFQECDFTYDNVKALYLLTGHPITYVVNNQQQVPLVFDFDNKTIGFSANTYSYVAPYIEREVAIAEQTRVEDTNGVFYSQRIEFTIPQVKLQDIEDIYSFFYDNSFQKPRRNIVAVFETFAGEHWIFGLEFGMQLREDEKTTGAFDDDNSIRLLLNTQQQAKALKGV